MGTEEETWEFAGWGSSSRITDLAPGPGGSGHAHHMLGTWPATAICGNDITSSCLYVSALCAVQAGPWAPVVLLVVAAVLYLFRSVYAEVGGALPLNGGTYTVLLNTTNKRVAAVAAVLTILSYVATAVISAGEAMHYLHGIVEAVPVFWSTVGLLGLFAVLGVVGITESAAVAVAVGIFALHMGTLTLLSVAGTITIAMDPSLLWENLALPPPGSLPRALFFGFAAAMLGISGFESSANFIEEQKAGVFPKTLRNMWLAVAVFNPLISLLSLGLLPLAAIQQLPPDLLAEMGHNSAGAWLGWLVAIDAVLVLSGAVLTSYVGVTGLMKRMALDRVLPQFMLAENRARGTNHWLFLSFFAVCVSILAVTGGKVTTLAGVYTISFLSVMALFAIGNMLLKVTRSQLPRDVRASWPTVTLALFAVPVGLAGNLLLDPTYVQVFGTYFAIAAALVGVMFLRVQLLRVLLFVVRAVVESANALNERVRSAVQALITDINSQSMVYFTKGDNLAQLNRAALYVLENEQTTRLTVIHVYDREEDLPPKLAEHLTTIDHQYPQLRIDFLAVQGSFGPPLIGALSARLKVPRNCMFLGTPGDRFPFRIETLGGVRLIL